MIFNFDYKTVTKKREKTGVFCLAPSNDFASDFVAGLLQRSPDVLNSRPELLGQIRILTSNKRSAQRLEEAFHEVGYTILPKITPLQDLTDFFYTANFQEYCDVLKKVKLPVVSKIEKYLIVESLLRRDLKNSISEMTPSSTFDLARSIGNLIDEINMKNLNPVDLEKASDDELSKHWQLSIALLKNTLLGYSDAIEKAGRIDVQTKYNLEVQVLCEAWLSQPYKSPLIIMGSTGSQYATSRLMLAVSNLPQGVVILPGLDKQIPGSFWEHLGPDHPQYSYYSLAKFWQKNSREKNEIIRAPEWNSEKAREGNKTIMLRSRVISEIMLPFQFTDRWILTGPQLIDGLGLAFKDVSLIEAENLRIEAASIAAYIAKALTRDLKVAVITPSKLLARGLKAELERWNIVPNTSFGQYLGATDIGIFLRQSALALSNKLEIENVISLLKNVNCGNRDPLHSINVNKLECLFIELGDSCLDSENQQFSDDYGEEFTAWYFWLQELIQSLKVQLEPAPLKNLLSLHRRFMKKLYEGCNYNIKGNEKKNSDAMLWESNIGQMVLNILGDLSQLPETGEVYTFLQYKKIIDEALFEDEINTEEELMFPSVSIWGTLESRTQSADVIILAALNEGDWPASFSEDPWLGRPVRKLIGLDLPERKIGLSAHDFQQAAMGKELILSRALRDTRGTASASRWLMRLENFLIGSGNRGIKIWRDIKSRGLALINSAEHYYSSEERVASLPPSISCLTSRPAPIPPLAVRPGNLYVTEVNTLVENPYALYAKRILKLKKFPNLGGIADRRTRGTIIHRAMENFIARTFGVLPEIDEACELLKRIIHSEIDSEIIPSEVKKLWKFQFDLRIRSIVEGEFKRRERAKPFALEAYGKYEIVLSDTDTFYITAKVDRIDKEPEGFLIYDYKTGQVLQKDLDKFSPQLDIEALILESGSFKGVPKGRVLALALISLGSKPKQINKLVKSRDLKNWHDAITTLVKNMKLELSPFYARLDTKRRSYSFDDYDHLSRYGEWLDEDEFCEQKLHLHFPKGRHN